MVWFFRYIDNFIKELGHLEYLLALPFFDGTAGSEESMFEYLWSSEEAQRCLTVEVTPAGKSEEKAKSFRIKGNTFYQKRFLQQALSCYNLSIMFSPCPPMSLNSHSPNDSGVAAVSDDGLTKSESKVPGENTTDVSVGFESEMQGACRSLEAFSLNHTCTTSFATDSERTTMALKAGQTVHHKLSEPQGKKSLSENVDSTLQSSNPPNKGSIPKQEKAVQLGLRNKDIGHTEAPNRELALAYGNRSAVLFELQQYEDSLLDIKRALHSGYPKELQNKLLQRKSKCLSALRSGKQKEKLVSYFPSTDKVVVPSTKITGASAALKLSYTPEKGRCMVAKRDIRPGEVLLVTEDFVSGLDKAYLATNCSTCLAHCLVPVPCPQCSLVIFCSELCRSKGLAGFHRKECQVLPALLCHTYVLMSYRLLMQITHAKVKASVPILRKEAQTRKKAKLGLNDDSVYDSSDYRAVYHLQTNIEQSSFSDNLNQCAMAVSVTKLLVESRQYFVDESGAPFTPSIEDLLLTGSTAFHHILSFECNSHTVGECKVQQNLLDFTERTIGCGLSPVLSLFNHSCYPTALFTDTECQVKVTATRSVKAGEELTIGYIRTFNATDVSLRRKQLQKYYFDCNCEACNGGWFLLAAPTAKFRIKCPVCGGKTKYGSKSCPRCQKLYGPDGGVRIYDTYSLSEIHSKISRAMLEVSKLITHFDSNLASEEKVDKLVRLIELFDRFILPPNKVHLYLQMILGCCHLCTKRRYVIMGI